MLVAPSLHRSGRTYKWTDTADLRPTRDLPEAPAWAVELLGTAVREDAAPVALGPVRCSGDGRDVWERVRPRLEERIVMAVEQGPEAYEPLPGRDPSPSGADAAVCYALIRCGLRDDEIHAVYQSFAIGQLGKYAKRGDAYLARTLRNMRAEAERNPLPRLQITGASDTGLGVDDASITQTLTDLLDGAARGATRTLRRALETPETLTTLVTTLTRDPAAYKGFLLGLREQGVTVRDAETFDQAGKAEARNRARLARAARMSTAAGGGTGQREIDAGNLNLPEVTAAAWEALLARNTPPHLFRLGGVMTRLETDDQGRPTLQTVDDDRLRHELARATNWYKVNESGPEPALPPLHVVKDMRATPDVPLPVLVRLVQAPVFGPDGSMQTEPGYHPGSRTYYHRARDFAERAVSAEPTAAEVAEARALILDELLAISPSPAMRSGRTRWPS